LDHARESKKTENVTFLETFLETYAPAAGLVAETEQLSVDSSEKVKESGEKEKEKEVTI